MTAASNSLLPGDDMMDVRPVRQADGSGVYGVEKFIYSEISRAVYFLSPIFS